MDPELVIRAQRGDGEAFASLAWHAATGCTRSRIGSCAMWIWPRTRPSRRCSRSGRTFPSSATRPALRPGRTASSSTPATTRVAGGEFGIQTCTSCATTTRRPRRPRPGPRSGPARARLPPAVDRPSCGGRAAHVPRPVARGDRRHPRRFARHESDLDSTTPCARCARRSTLTNGPRSGGRAMTTERDDPAHHRVVDGGWPNPAYGPCPRRRARSAPFDPQSRPGWSARRIDPRECTRQVRDRGRCRGGRRDRRYLTCGARRPGPGRGRVALVRWRSRHRRREARLQSHRRAAPWTPVAIDGRRRAETSPS